jgi:signal transduction histidine kinase
MSRLRLHHRITVPFVVVVLLATSSVALVALNVTSRALRSRLQSQLEGALSVVGQGDFALNLAILQNVRAVLGAEVLTLGERGEVLASTAGSDRTPLIDAVRAILAERPPAGDEALVVSADCGEPCMIAARPLAGRPGAVVALIAETSELRAATQAVTRAIVLGSAASAIVMLLVGHVVVRRVTAPLRRLLDFVRRVSGGVRERAAVSDDEIGVLAEAFNGMLDRLEQSQEALVRSEKLAVTGLVAARVAHDVRNPLSSIKMQTQLLQARLGRDPEDAATLASVIQDIELVERVVRDLVETARPGELKREATSVNAVIRAALQQLAPQFSHRKIGVGMTLASDVPDVALDGNRFQQALLNVFVNAAEAMPSGGEIVVESRRDGDQVRITICDEGTGIDPAIAERVFDPFVSTKREGVGLGLVNARAVVEGHGGRITLSPRQPRGTCASIALPI